VPQQYVTIPWTRRIAWYISIARPHHYFKNLLVVAGSLLAWWHLPETTPAPSPWLIAMAFMATCLLASSNYVLNEVLDAAHDGFHPRKNSRPMVNGSIPRTNAYLEWIALIAAGLTLAAWIGTSFLIVAAIFCLMAVAYNVPPFRLKDVPYIDVLCEAVNSPLRIILGWTIVQPASLPGPETVLAFWTAGAYLMARKRLKELMVLENPAVASAYRKSFTHYDQRRLLASMIAYAMLTLLLCGLYGQKVLSTGSSSRLSGGTQSAD
jgi:4-hydroxybenzoate polyprenyltransferase